MPKKVRNPSPRARATAPLPLEMPRPRPGFTLIYDVVTGLWRETSLEESRRREEMTKALRERTRLLLEAKRELSRVKGGAPPRGNKVAARKAYRDAIANGLKVEAAIAAACEQGGYRSKSRVYELKKEERWDWEE